MTDSRNPKAVNNTITDIHYRIMQARNTAVRKREARQQARPAEEAPKINRQTVISNMADRLSASICRQLPAAKKNQTLQTKMRDTAFELLKNGLEVDAVAEKLIVMFGGG